MRKRFLTDIHALANKALSAGGTRVSPGEVHWDISSGCEKPFRTECYARPSSKRKNVQNDYVVVKPGSQSPFMVVLETPCHRCKVCANRKAALWRRRIVHEYQFGLGRVWLGTLTVRPQERFSVLTQARARAAQEGEDFDLLPASERARRLHVLFGRQLQLMLKRERKRSPFRFLAVGELHEDGFPHYHLLIHEVRDIPIRHSALSTWWKLGFSNWKLVTDVRGATYVAKYLQKTQANGWARVRASIGYGQIGPL